MTESSMRNERHRRFLFESWIFESLETRRAWSCRKQKRRPQPPFLEVGNSFHVNIARTGMQIKQRTAISYFSLDPVVRDGSALNRRRDFKASR